MARSLCSIDKTQAVLSMKMLSVISRAKALRDLAQQEVGN
jgi:hypothetical protein